MLVLLLSISFIPLVDSQEKITGFKHISFREGLAQSPISTIFKDSQGFIWIGNWKGLTRYDGYQFKTFNYRDGDRKSLSNNRVNSICQDKKQRLWVATSHGLNRFDRKTETFLTIGIRPQEKGGRNYISSVTTDSDGKIWIGTFGGVKLVDTLNLKVLDIAGFRRQKDLDTGVVFTLFRDSQTRIWAGTKNGVQLFNPRTRSVVPLPRELRENNALMQAKVLVVTQDKQGNMWFGTESSGLFEYNIKTGTVQQYEHQGDTGGLPGNWIKGLLVRGSKIWVGTRAGLSIFDPGTRRFENHYHNPFDANSLSDNTVWSFYQDDAGSVWIGTFAGGINIYNPLNANFQNIGEKLGPGIGLSNTVVNTILASGDGGFWAGTQSGGLNYIHPGRGESKSYVIKMDPRRSSNYVKCVAEDGKGSLWLGTLDGLALFNKESKQIKYYTFPAEGAKLSGNLVNFVLPDKRGVWAGTNGSGLRYMSNDGSSITFRKSDGPDAITDNFVTVLLKDDKDNLWVGTQNGLNYLDVKKQKFIYRFLKSRSRNSISHATVLCLFRDSGGRLWIGTEGGGLNYFDESKKEFHAINANLGLTDNVIHAIVEDNSKNIWVSTDDGLYKIYFRKFEFPFSSKNIHITHYTANDGLASNQFLTNAAIKSFDGKLFFGGINGLTSFYPERIIKNIYKPAVVLTDLLIKNQRVNIGDEDGVLKESISETQAITLNYDQGFITLQFAALNYINPADNAYEYKLDGLRTNDDWTYSGTRNTANYTNLEPGTYYFKVKGANNDGLWNENPTVLKIKVLPPLWKTWWAFLLYALVLLTVVAVVIRFLKIRADLERNLYYEHLQNERQKELYQLKLDFFTNISHEIRTPLTLIIGPLEKALGTLRNSHSVYSQLTIVRNNAERLMRLVNELLDFRKAETGNMKLQFAESNIQKFVEEIFLSFKALAANRGIHYSLESLDSPLKVYFDKDQLEKVLFNIFSNAFKFTPDYGRITVSLQRRSEGEQEWIDIVISDNGRGIPEEFHEKLFENFFQVEGRDFSIGTGIGLALSKSIMELHKGSIRVKSRPEQNGELGETHFTVSLLLGKEHLKSEILVPDYMNSENAELYQIQSDVTELIIVEKEVPQEKRHSVLIVEDNDEVRQFIKEALVSCYHILESTDGVSGLNSACENIPDLIISDVMMPNMDGLELCRRIKRDERTNHIPVILLTARTAYIHQVNGFDNGADAYITKPFSVQILELQVRNILASKDALRLKYSSQILLQPQNFTVESPEEKFLKKLMEIVERKMENPDFAVAHLVDEIGMSKTVLYRKVHALTGSSIGEFIKSVRLKRAAMLLQQNKIGIAEVAYSVGFNDRKYFSKEFKKQYKLSPSEYILQFTAEAAE